MLALFLNSSKSNNKMVMLLLFLLMILMMMLMLMMIAVRQQKRTHPKESGVVHLCPQLSLLRALGCREFDRVKNIFFP